MSVAKKTLKNKLAKMKKLCSPASRPLDTMTCMYQLICMFTDYLDEQWQELEKTIEEKYHAKTK